MESSHSSGGGSSRASVMEAARRVAGDAPTPMPRSLLCPYCGGVTDDAARCGGCGGRFDPLSRQATQNHMGPWAVRDPERPHSPGIGFETLCRQIEAGRVTTESVVRGPTTRQFWTLARHTPGVASRFGVCHSCRASVEPDAFQCPSCQASFQVDRDRQHLGLGPARPLTGAGSPELAAMKAGMAPSSPQAGVLNATVELPRIADERQRTAPEPADSARGEMWRRASESDRRNGLVAVVLAASVVVTALVYSTIVVRRSSGGLDRGGDQVVPVGLRDESAE